MKVALQAVRVYGSRTARYGVRPRLDPLGQPITLTQYPSAAEGHIHRSLIYLGAPVESVVQAARIRMAIGRILLGWLTGNTPGANPDVAIKEALQQIEDPLRSVGDWYITILIEREIEVEDHLINDSAYVWLDDKAAYQYENGFKAFAAPYIDRLAVYVGTVIDPACLETIVLSDRVFFSAAHHTPFGLPRSYTPVRPSILQSLDDLSIELLEQRLQASARLSDQQQEWLDGVKHWYLAALGEQDVWKQFFWSYLCLELLSEQLAPRLYDRAMTTLGIKSGDTCAPGSPPLIRALCTSKGQIASHTDLLAPGKFLRGKFALVTQALFPTTATAELNTFEQLTVARNSLAHGDHLDAMNLPIAAARELTQRYLAASVADQLSSNP